MYGAYLGRMDFFGFAPILPNFLPPNIRNSSFLPIFRSKLKIHVFKLVLPLEFSPIPLAVYFQSYPKIISKRFSISMVNNETKTDHT